jgi:hypothetical protein
VAGYVEVDRPRLLPDSNDGGVLQVRCVQPICDPQVGSQSARPRHRAEAALQQAVCGSTGPRWMQVDRRGNIVALGAREALEPLAADNFVTRPGMPPRANAVADLVQPARRLQKRTLFRRNAKRPSRRVKQIQGQRGDVAGVGLFVAVLHAQFLDGKSA